MKKALLILAAIVLAFSAAACGAAPAAEEQTNTSFAPSHTYEPSKTSDIKVNIAVSDNTPKYVFIMIGDGMGAAQRQLAESYLQYEMGMPGAELVMNKLPVKGNVTTYSLSSKITDSAASGTAIATGHKTNNGMVAITPEGDELTTIMEAANEELGMATGLITTSRLTDATPAAFAAHADDRGEEAAIAQQLLESGVDFLAGGGAAYFLPKSYTGGFDAAGKSLKSARDDEDDLVSGFEQRDYMTFLGEQGAQDFRFYSPEENEKVFAAFTNSSMPFEIDRISYGLYSPTLAEMTDKAIQCLAGDEDGFMLMVEGGRIDHACHINDAAGAVRETIAFDEAVGEAYEFYKEHPKDTLIIVLADHETGGLTLPETACNFSPVDAVKVSVLDRLQKVYDGDRKAFYAYMAENMGLGDITLSEKAEIEAAFDYADKKTKEGDYGNYNAPAVAASRLVSARVGVSWTTLSHTGVDIPLTAVGIGAESFKGRMDNAQVGEALFDVLGLDW